MTVFSKVQQCTVGVGGRSGIVQDRWADEHARREEHGCRVSRRVGEPLRRWGTVSTVWATIVSPVAEAG